MNIVDINKKYTTRDGREVVIFEVSDKVYCKIRENEEWFSTSRHPNGRLFMGAENGSELRSVKAWRAWKEGEGPKRLMIRAKGSPNGSCEVLVREGFSYSNERLFVDFVWLHEDGTITPCGVCE